jgi:DinB superfamily
MTHPQLQAVIDEFGTAQARFHALAAATRAADWARRPEPARWSIAECVAHLNLTSATFLPALHQALEGKPKSTVTRRYRRDPLGWLLWLTMAPPARIRLKTAAAFIPQGTAEAAELVAEFDRLQAEQVACVRSAEGLPLGDLWIRSPFDPRIRYNVYSALTILPRHQHRHLWQAERVRVTLEGTK